MPVFIVINALTNTVVAHKILQHRDAARIWFMETYGPQYRLAELIQMSNAPKIRRLR